jgi:beta-N-acetylhexosaminidase
MMNQDKSAFIENLLSKMTIPQKVGQCLVIGFVGTVLTPEIIHRIQRYSPAGIRAGLTFRIKTAIHDPTAVGNNRYTSRVVRNPKGTVKDYLPGLPVPHCTNEEYCEFINTLKKAALENEVGIPLHITMDMEGDSSADYNRGGIHYFPSPMSCSLAHKPELAHDVAWAVGRQLLPIGCDWIHSPVLDVNTHPMNPEIGSRSYGEDPDTVIEYALEALKGYQEAGIITTGKHFPGRGASETDAHNHMPVIDLTEAEMEKHLAPFQKLIDAGIPSIMTAHTSYPSLDPSGLPATLSKTILTDLLKNKMGFKGVITTDDITMGGIIEKYEVPEACRLALEAGADLILIRDESPLIDEVFEGLVLAVQNGQLKEERLNDAIRRTLSVKYDYGMFEKGSLRTTNKAGEGIHDARVVQIATEAAQAGVVVLRDQQGILPLSPLTKVLLIEQINPLHRITNSQACHPGILWEKMLKKSENVAMVETNLVLTEQDYERIKSRLDEADVIVATDYYYRNQAKDDVYGKALMELGKPVIVVTNTHYPTAVRPSYQSVVVTYGVGPESMAAVADTLYRKK